MIALGVKVYQKRSVWFGEREAVAIVLDGPRGWIVEVPGSSDMTAQLGICEEDLFAWKEEAQTCAGSSSC
jgi:hypothetical protein